MKALVLFILSIILFTTPALSQSGEEKRLKSFFEAVADKNIQAEVIIDEFVCQNFGENPSKAKEIKGYLVDLIYELRDELKEKQVSELNFVQYSTLSDSDKTLGGGKVAIGDYKEDTTYDDFIYVIKYKGEVLINVFLKENTIYSLTTMNMGSVKIISLYCDL